MRRNVKLILAYRGCPYLGWQETGSGPSIEGELQRAVERFLRHPVQLQAASRTDAGVHASGQVINFFTDSEISHSILFKALNNLLPPQIRVIDVADAPADFHPTLDAVGKNYLYRLSNLPLPRWRHLAWHCPNLNFEMMEEATKLFVGTHDFRAFCNQRKDLRYPSTVRTLSRVSLEPWEGGTTIQIEGDSFLYKMVRNLVGTLVAVGRGTLTEEGVQALLAGGQRCDAGVTAPAKGLSLENVFY